MKNLIFATLLLGLVVSCNKDEPAKKAVVDYPIKFTLDATPNNWEYVNRVNQNTLVCDFTTPNRLSKTFDTYLVQTSITSDFSVVKWSGSVNAYSSIPEVKKFSTTLYKGDYPFQGNIYFRVIRDADKTSSETRVIKVNWN